MSVETMARLAELPNIVGVKDATADLTRPTLTRLAIPSDFNQMSGEDGTAIGFFAQGGHGCISVTANVAPRACAEFYAAWKAGDAAKALELHTRLMPLHDVLFCESNPIPVKYAAYLLGKCRSEMRLPMCAPASASKQRIEAALRALGVLKDSAA